MPYPLRSKLCKKNILAGKAGPTLAMQEISVLNGLTGEGALNGFPLLVTHSKSFGKDELMLRAQVEKENKFKFNLIFPEQGSLYRF
jgi:hypothetical protein